MIPRDGSKRRKAWNGKDTWAYSAPNCKDELLRLRDQFRKFFHHIYENSLDPQRHVKTAKLAVYPLNDLAMEVETKASLGLTSFPD